ncbi:aminoglycoside adenylyltransferase domain-containing protein [Deinococcus alpinitundrae]|uniref:aminoglycoside adenylyltransferase domain-containing protein n=1 Tax=Deinococcus alpinitundrae TaxID=468913 RepID=UPI001379E41B|nr:aminoglycoside adenylyltransferase domain-containing protein [Deinococcus alpinitundrae]
MVQVIPAEVQTLLDQLLVGQTAVLGANLLGLYRRGSLVTGDFDPHTSDVDALCVTETPLSAAEFEGLAAMHLRLAESSNRYATELEVAYLPRAAARRWQSGQRWPTLYRGSGALTEQLHGENWVLERWAILRGGQSSVLFGPSPRMLFEPVSDGQLRRAVLGRLRDWHAFALTPDDPSWSQRSHAAYAIETTCRMLHTLGTGQLGSKPAAVRWARLNLPQPWRTLVERTPNWKNDPAVDAALNAEVQDFIFWAAQRAARAAPISRSS